MHYVGTRHPLAASNPLRSMPFMRTRAQVFGPTPLEAAQIKLAQLQSYLPGLIGARHMDQCTIGSACAWSLTFHVRSSSRPIAAMVQDDVDGGPGAAIPAVASGRRIEP